VRWQRQAEIKTLKLSEIKGWCWSDAEETKLLPPKSEESGFNFN